MSARLLAAIVVATIWAVAGDATPASPRSRVALPTVQRPVRMVDAPARVRRACERSRLVRAACPRRLPFVGRAPAWSVFLCRQGARGCLGLNWDDLELQHVGRGPMRPPTWAHIAIFAGDLKRAFPFVYPAGGKAISLRDGMFTHEWSHAVFFGTRRWGGKIGSLVLAPGYSRGGEQGDHLIFRWRVNGIDYAIGLHGWEPLTQAAGTLRAIVISAGT